MDIISLTNGKGGVGKSTVTPPLAAALKRLYPWLRIGVMAADSTNGSLSKLYAQDLENADQGLWNIIDALFSRRRATNVDAGKEAILGAVRPLTIIPEHCITPRRQADFIRDAKALGVDPSRPLECRQIQFIGTAKELGKEIYTLPALNQPDSHKTAGVPLLQAISDTLDLDICLVDLPGEIHDCLVKLILPWCTAVVVLADVTKPENLTMEEDMVVTLRAMNVEPAGFLANKLSNDSVSRGALRSLEGIAGRYNLPVLGKVKNLPTIAIANRAYDDRGNVILPQPENGQPWCTPEGGFQVGLYRAALDFRTNQTIQRANASAAREIEQVAVALAARIPNIEERNRQRKAERQSPVEV